MVGTEAIRMQGHSADFTPVVGPLFAKLADSLDLRLLDEVGLGVVEAQALLGGPAGPGHGLPSSLPVGGALVEVRVVVNQELHTLPLELQQVHLLLFLLLLPQSLPEFLPLYSLQLCSGHHEAAHVCLTVSSSSIFLSLPLPQLGVALLHGLAEQAPGLHQLDIQEPGVEWPVPFFVPEGDAVVFRVLVE